MDPSEVRQVGTTRVTVPVLGLGGSALGGFQDRKPVSDADAAHAYEAAWTAGFRYFDTAPRYGVGRGERRLGCALREQSREAYRLSTEVGILEDLPPGDDGARTVRCDYGYEATMRSVESSLERLGTDHLEMVFVHDIGPQTHGPNGGERRFREAMDGALPALVRLRAEGMVGAIGVGIRSVEVCIRTLTCADVDVFMLAGRYTLLDHSALDALLPMCTAREVSAVVAAPFNSGILATGALPRARHDERPAGAAVRARTREIEAICAAHRVPVGAAALQFPLAHPAIVAVAPGPSSARQVEAVAGWFRRSIPPGVWTALREAGVIGAEAPVPTA